MTTDNLVCKYKNKGNMVKVRLWVKYAAGTIFRRSILTLVINRKLSNFKQKQGNT